MAEEDPARVATPGKRESRVDRAYVALSLTLILLLLGWAGFAADPDLYLPDAI